jgi:hypothetical protein
MAPSRRRPSLAVALAVLAMAALVFQHRQNVAGGIGGPISLPKLLWLTYALAAWFVLPYYFWRAGALSPGLRRVFGLHLSSFILRGAVELWLIFVLVAWIPPYGIAHDVFDILLITAALRAVPTAASAAERAARRFLTSIRIALCCEIAFAWLFHQAVDARTGIYFASSDPMWIFINRCTWAALAFALPDLVATLFSARDVLFPRVPVSPGATVPLAVEFPRA